MIISVICLEYVSRYATDILIGLAYFIPFLAPFTPFGEAKCQREQHPGFLRRFTVSPYSFHWSSGRLLRRPRVADRFVDVFGRLTNYGKPFSMVL